MATITSNGTGGGLASATSTWAGGVVPVEGDKVIIAAGDMVEIDGTYTWGDGSYTETAGSAAVTISGRLKASRTASSSLTCYGLLFGDSSTGGVFDYGTQESPIPDGVVAELILNKKDVPDDVRGFRYVASATSHNVTILGHGSTVRERGVKLASDAAAAAYTGVTINNTTKEISFGAGTADTHAKFYDYHQAIICANLDYDVAVVRAGSLYSLHDDWTVVDPAYSGLMTWGGGTVQYSAVGTYSDNIDGSIVELAAAGGGTYTFTGSLNGTLDLRNLDAAAITVELPSGSSYSTADNAGGAITVTTPQLYQSVTVANLTTGSRVQIYDSSNSAELANELASGATVTWTDSTPAAAPRDIRVRIAYVSGATAKEFVEEDIGTCGTDESTAGLSYRANQSNDATYNDNALDGSTVTGVTFTDSSVDLMNINLSAGDTNLQKLYASWVYYASTEAGIRTDIDYIQAIDTANYVYSNLIWKNTTSPSVPLKISGGYAWDATTGDPIDLVDTTGGTIFLAPPHVVSKVVTVSGVNVITGDIADVPSAADIAEGVLTDSRSLTVAKYLGLK